MKGGYLPYIIGFSILVGILDIIAGVLGLQAEKAQKSIECERALTLAFTAALCSALAQIIACVMGYLIEKRASVPTYISVAYTCVYGLVVGVGFITFEMGIRSINEGVSKKCGFANIHHLSIASYMCFVQAIVSVSLLALLSYSARRNLSFRIPQPE